MSKLVTLSKTFSNEAEYEHFKKLYDANTTAFENRWNLDVEGEKAAPTEAAEPTVKQSVLAKFEAQVEKITTELKLTIEDAWAYVNAEMTNAEAEESEEGTSGEGSNENGGADTNTGAGDEGNASDTEGDVQKTDGASGEGETTGEEKKVDAQAETGKAAA